jgi:iron complex transport system substrate-binding protein
MINCNLRKLIVSLLLSLLLFSCSSNSSQVTPAKSDLKTVNKVVALTSLSADIIQHLDATKLVGITGSSILTKNPEFVKIETVSGDRTPPNLEKIIALQPDLVIGAAGFHDRVLEKLQQTGIETITSDLKNWDSFVNLTKTLAEKIQADPTPLLTQYQTFLDPKPQTTESVLVLTSSQPIIAPNKNSWAGDLLTQFNLNNVVANLQGDSPFQGYINLSAEKILEANPDILIVVDTGTEVIEQLKTKPFWQELKATKNNHVYVFDYYGLVNPGTINSIEIACQKLKEIDQNL